MTMMILDGLLMLVVGWGIVYAWRTSAKMHNIKNEMKPVTRQLGSYLNTIGQHVQQLRETTENNRKVLTEQLPQAKALRDDFEVFLDHGQRLADRLDALLEQAYAVERNLREANTAIGKASSKYQAPIMRSDINPYAAVMQQTPPPPPGAVMPPQFVYAPPPPAQPMSPYLTQPVDTLEAARAHAAQVRDEVSQRLKGVRF